jgi:hypothetical protein
MAITNQHIGESTSSYAELWPMLKAGEIVVGDRGFSSYHLLAGLMQRKVDFLVRVSEPHRRIWKKELIGPNQWRVTFKRTQCRNEIYREDWKHVPKELVLRLIRVPIRDREGRGEDLWLLTSLPDSAARLASLYRARWRIEIGYRDLKRTMGMYRIRAKSAEGVEKEIHAFIVGYHLLRFLHLKAVRSHGGQWTRLSVKTTIDALRHFLSHASCKPFWSTTAKRWQDALLSFLSAAANPVRPNRWAPRKRKFRDRGVGWLTRHRKLYENDYFTNASKA